MDVLVTAHTKTQRAQRNHRKIHKPVGYVVLQPILLCGRGRQRARALGTAHEAAVDSLVTAPALEAVLDVFLSNACSVDELDIGVAELG